MAEQQYDPLTQIIGRVGQAPERRTTGNGKELVKFSVAVQDGYGQDANTTWHNVAVWNEKLQELVMDEVQKGQTVCVEGPAKVRKADGKEYHDISAFRVGAVAWIVAGRGAKKSADDDELGF
jgi:single-strand DNA-binding protein